MRLVEKCGCNGNSGKLRQLPRVLSVNERNGLQGRRLKPDQRVGGTTTARRAGTARVEGAKMETVRLIATRTKNSEERKRMVLSMLRTVKETASGTGAVGRRERNKSGQS